MSAVCPIRRHGRKPQAFAILEEAMSRLIRYSVRLVAGLSALVMVGIGSAAYAYVAPPGDGGSGAGAATAATQPATQVIRVSSTSFLEHLGWMALGAVAVIAVIGIAVAVVRVSGRRLQPQ
jgi:hypothetical protein